ncbi:hypothetical protein NUW58_g6213 [Xylaria curta]|uniref:Uncharacterized protein n=1 Tax=Xylaria curta TaxID=42375 RepID=A0ACC1NWB3_9PEZI|nr:hypothetical protein NUW58_g6213 [Xylaria curta]
MRLLKTEGGGFTLTKEFSNDGDIPPYAILSHTWGDREDEIFMNDIKENRYKKKAAYRKLRYCAARANADNLQHFWIDTCCIDQASSNELSKAINSMFKWAPSWESAFHQSRWFTRGWTLQELLAPRSVDFISRDGEKLGDKVSLERDIQRITGIDLAALRGSDLGNFSFEERMSWAAGRQTKEDEDMVYSMLGIFGVFMPLIYGEGREHAHMRLRELIEKLPTDKSKPNPKPKPKSQSQSQPLSLSLSQTRSWSQQQPVAFYRTESAPTPRATRSWNDVFCDKCNESGHRADDLHCYK